DRAGRDPDLAAVDGLGLPGRALAREDLAQQGRGEPSEGAAAAYLHFEEQGLALMQRHAARRADRLTPPLGRQAALVEGMPGLVQRAHQRLREIGLVVAC